MWLSPKIKTRNKKREAVNKDIKFGIVKEMFGQAYDADKQLIVHDATRESFRCCCSDIVGV